MGQTGVNLNYAVKLADPKNHTIEQKLRLYLVYSWSYDSLIFFKFYVIRQDNTYLT